MHVIVAVEACSRAVELRSLNVPAEFELKAGKHTNTRRFVSGVCSLPTQTNHVFRMAPCTVVEATLELSKREDAKRRTSSLIVSKIFRQPDSVLQRFARFVDSSKATLGFTKVV